MKARTRGNAILPPLLAAFCACLATVPARAGITVELRASATVSGDYVRLGAVAEVRGAEERRERVAGLYLGPVPPAGESRRLTRAQVRDRLLEVGLARGVILRGAEAVVITRSSPAAGPGRAVVAAVSRGSGRAAGSAGASRARSRGNEVPPRLASRVRAAVTAYLQEAFNRRDLEVRVAVRGVRAPGGVKGEGALRLERVVSGRLPGRARVSLARLGPRERAEAEFTAEVEARAFAQVLLLRRNLARGERLQPGDLMLRRCELKAGVAYMPLDAAALAGKETARYLRALRPLVAGDLAVPAAVVKNQLVAVTARAGGFLVTLRARALGAGRPGELVEVENPDSGKRFMVQVTGFGAARLPQAREER